MIHMPHTPPNFAMTIPLDFVKVSWKPHGHEAADDLYLILLAHNRDDAYSQAIPKGIPLALLFLTPHPIAPSSSWHKPHQA